MMNNKSLLKKTTVFLIVALMACGSLFASDMESGSVLKTGVVEDGLVGHLAKEAGVSGEIALDVSSEFAEKYFEGYFVEDDTFAKEKAELLPEELEALRRSAAIIEATGGIFDMAMIDEAEISLKESVTLMKFMADYAKSLDNIKKGKVYNMDVFAVAGLIGLFTGFDEIMVEVADGSMVSLGDIIMNGGELAEKDSEEITETELGFGIMGAVIYFDVLCRSYGIDLVAADIIPGAEF